MLFRGSVLHQLSDHPVKSKRLPSVQQSMGLRNWAPWCQEMPKVSAMIGNRTGQEVLWGLFRYIWTRRLHHAARCFFHYLVHVVLLSFTDKFWRYFIYSSRTPVGLLSIGYKDILEDTGSADQFGSFQSLGVMIASEVIPLKSDVPLTRINENVRGNFEFFIRPCNLRYMTF